MMDTGTRERIYTIILRAAQSRFTKKANDKRETEYNPFLQAFFSRKDIAKSALMHSFSTSIGMSAYEQIAEALVSARPGFSSANITRQYRLTGQIDGQTESVIAQLMNERGLSRNEEINKVRQSILPSTHATSITDKDSVVDIHVTFPDGSLMLIDITTVKPSKKEFDYLHQKMLRWHALTYSLNTKAFVNAYIGIPFNPYHPKPYKRWTVKFDPDFIVVQNELWSLLAGYDVFDEIVDVFNEVGLALRDQLDAYLET
jgi:type II restriction enzyme